MRPSTDAFHDELEKIARISGSRLAGMLKGESPLFHMVGDANVPSFLKSRKLMSPVEANKRGLLNDYEGSIGLRRYAPEDAPELPVRLGDGGASVAGPDLVRAADVWHPEDLMWQTGLPGDIGTYQRRLALSYAGRQAKSGKNWPSISFSDEPLKRYGGVGMMSTPRQMRGELASFQRYGDYPNEHQLLPEMHTKGGLWDRADLPRAEGTPVYDPHRTPRELAKKLKAQGAIPLNARFYRKLKGMRRAGAVPKWRDFPDPEAGNATWEEMETAAGGRPSVERLRTAAKERLG